MASDRSVVQSLDRALSILDVLRLSDSGLALGDIAGRSGLPKSTTHRLLATLARRALVLRDPGTGKYRLATKTYEPVGAGPGVRQVLEDLATMSGETANLGALIGNEVLYVDRADSPHALRWQLGVGSRVPAHCSALGKAILASMPPGEAVRRLPRRFEAFTARTLTNRAAFMDELARTRARRFAVDDEEFMDGVRCVAVAVGDDQTGGVAHAISLAGPAFRWSLDRAETFVPAMHEAAGRIDELLAAEGLRRSPGA
jgi:DNA-binding IclR family transcriptional regulator